MLLAVLGAGEDRPLAPVGQTAAVAVGVHLDEQRLEDAGFEARELGTNFLVRQRAEGVDRGAAGSRCDEHETDPVDQQG